MTYTEFNDEFDELYNNVTSDMAPGLDDYDKSVFLTQAQEEIVTQLYSGTSGVGFEDSELNRRYLANLITYSQQTPSTYTLYGTYRVYPFTLVKPLAIISEQVIIEDSDCCGQDKYINVVPTKYDELNIVMNNPFRRPNNRKALRVDKSTNEVQIISKNGIKQYLCEYLKKPAPIIVGNLGSLSVDGVSTPQTSALDESLHKTILKYAVQLAAASWASNNKS